MKKRRKKYQRKKPSWLGILFLTILAWVLIPIIIINLILTVGAILALPWWTMKLGWIVVGFIGYSLIHIFIYKPTFLYVLPHELSHALFAWIFGEKVKKIKVRDTGGYVEMSHSNFIIDLAPYFFPFYAFWLAVINFFLKYFWHYRQYEYLFLFGVGGALAFHYLNSRDILHYKQTDMMWTGRWFGIVFSIIVNIFFANVILLLIFFDEKNLIFDYYGRAYSFVLNLL